VRGVRDMQEILGFSAFMVCSTRSACTVWVDFPSISSFASAGNFSRFGTGGISIPSTRPVTQ
jgi:hypothetical protein